MGLIFTDGFDSYAATSDLTKKWALVQSPWTWNATAGRNGGGGVTLAGSNTAELISQDVLGGATSGIAHIGFYVKMSAAAAARSNLFAFLDNLGNVNQCMTILTAGQIELRDSASSSTLATGSKNICDSKWHWIEIKVNLANSSQSQQIYVDGSVEISVTGNYGDNNQGFRKLVFGPNSANLGAITGLDDIIVYDNNGNSPKDSDYPLGPREIITLRPASDSAVQFSPDSGGTNFSRVNETNADGDTSYVQDGTSGDQDLYGYGSLSVSPAAINGVMLNAYVENPNAGTINHTQICKSSGVQANGTSTQTPTGYTTKQQFFGQDPATSAAWGQTGLNAATFGIKVG